MSIEVQGVGYLYEGGTPFEKQALKDVSFTVDKGEFIGLIGHTGSGKSTLIQTLNALLEPTEGKVLYDGMNIFDPEFKRRRREIRQKVGLVFQYPEHQLFEMTVYKDVAFGPGNMKLSEEEVRERVEWALDLVGLGPEVYEKSPFDLSGGQKRRVALAGVLAMRPEYLVLDEPAAGLDPRGRDDLFDEIASLRDRTGMTVILVSHSMDDVAQYVERILVMDHGHLIYDDKPARVFRHKEELTAMGLAVPEIVDLGDRLRERGFDLSEDIIRMEDMADAILKLFGKGGAK
ncbi:MAG: energy-coupling factor transporter ATPase [Firmicutes bacterium]|nr:energy-coupling factor transporter ATPase [Bacillota bacterium]